MNIRRLWMIAGLAIVLAEVAQAQQPMVASVSEILGQHDRALIRELSSYLKQNPKADDRDQGFAALFNKAIEHDWFTENEEMALSYLKNDPEGPVKALAQIITTMARAQAGRHDEALSRYVELMRGLGKSDQEDFATSFSETFASSAVAAGEFAIARQVYQALQERFPDSPSLRDKVARELGRLDRIGKPAPGFEAQDLSGKAVRLESFKGKYVLVDFWATWCSPCIGELPRLQEAYRKYHGVGFEILSVSLDETRTAVSDFVKVPQTAVAPTAQRLRGSRPRRCVRGQLNSRGIPRGSRGQDYSPRLARQQAGDHARPVDADTSSNAEMIRTKQGLDIY